MQSISISTVIFLVLSSSVHAQQNYYISPPGTESLEGNSSSSIQFDQAMSQVQQIDNTLTGTTAPLITGIAYRRNVNLTTTAIRTIEIELKVGHSNFGTVSNTYANNYKGAPTVAIAKKKINFDWTKSAKLTPAEYDAVLTFTTPFVYNRVDAFVWECNNTTGVAGTGYSQDWYSGSSPATIAGPRPTVLGAGCATPNGKMGLTSVFASSNATSLDYGFGVTAGPSNQPVVLLVGVSDPNVPLFCGTLHANPLLNLPIGSTSATGDLPLVTSNTAWTKSLIDIALFTQALALDASQASGVAMSNGLHSRTPREPGGSHAYAIKRSFTQNAANTTTGSAPSLSSVATKYIQ